MNDAVIDTVIDAFERRFGRSPEVVLRAPGRINLLGAHIDYSAGQVMPGAIDRAVWVAAAPARQRRWTALALDFEAEASVDLDALAPPSGSPRFIDVPAAVAWALEEAGHAPSGLDAVYAGDLPMGAGVSSSAAVEVAFLLAFERLSGLDLTSAVARARLCRRAENGYLGVQSGLMDPFASLAGREDHLLLLDCRDERAELLPLPAGTRYLIAHSGVSRRLADSGFNDRRAECAAALEILRRHRPALAALRDLERDEWQLLSHHLPPELRRRTLHAVEECARVGAGAEALRRGDLESFARLVRLSHLSSRDLYEVSIPELDVLAAAAWEVEGCWGARLAGGGFGGAVNVLAAPGAVDAVAAAMRHAFTRHFGREPRIWSGRLSDGAQAVSSIIAP